MDTEFRRHLDAGNLSGAGTWLVEQCADDVLGLCTAMVRDRVQAEDLAQDAFGKAFSHLASFRGDSSARTWLLAIARNRCLDYLRRQSRVGWVVTSDPDAGGDSASDAPLPPDLLRNRQEVARALDSLGEADRALVVLRFRHGLGYDELGVVFGIKPGTARMRVSRALARMRETLTPSRVGMPGAPPAAAPLAAVPPRAAPPRSGERERGKLQGDFKARLGIRRRAVKSMAGSALAPPETPSLDSFSDALAIAVAPAPARFRSKLSTLLATL